MTLWSWSQHRRKCIFLVFTICWIPCVNKACQHIDHELHVCQLQKILMETGFVILQNLDNLERSMKHRSLVILRKIKAGVIFSVCSNHPISQGWASLHNLQSQGSMRLMERNHIIPDSILVSTPPVSLKTLWRVKVKGAHKYLIQATGTLPTVLCYILHPLGTSILGFSGGGWFTH